MKNLFVLFFFIAIVACNNENRVIANKKTTDTISGRYTILNAEIYHNAADSLSVREIYINPDSVKIINSQWCKNAAKKK